MEVDFLKLTEANKLIAYWCNHFKVTNRYRMDLVAELHKDPSDRIKAINKKLQVKLQDDLQHMFYAYEVENFLIEKYVPAIYFVIKRMRIKHLTTREDCFCVGLSAIRSAIFTYQRPQKSFTTYVIDGITSFIRGYAFRQKKLRDEIKKTHGPFFRNEICDLQMEDTSDLSIEKLINAAELEESEIFLLNLYLESDHKLKWYAPYVKKYKTADGRRISRSGLYNKIKIIRYKMYHAICEIRGEIYAERFDPSINKYSAAI